MSGHYICDACGDEGGSHDKYCKYLRPIKDQWKGNLTKEELEKQLKVRKDKVND